MTDRADGKQKMRSKLFREHNNFLLDFAVAIAPDEAIIT